MCKVYRSNLSLFRRSRPSLPARPASKLSSTPSRLGVDGRMDTNLAWSPDIMSSTYSFFSFLEELLELDISPRLSERFTLLMRSSASASAALRASFSSFLMRRSSRRASLSSAVSSSSRDRVAFDLDRSALGLDERRREEDSAISRGVLNMVFLLSGSAFAERSCRVSMERYSSGSSSSSSSSL